MPSLGSRDAPAFLCCHPSSFAYVVQFQSTGSTRVFFSVEQIPGMSPVAAARAELIQLDFTLKSVRLSPWHRLFAGQMSALVLGPWSASSPPKSCSRGAETNSEALLPDCRNPFVCQLAVGRKFLFELLQRVSWWEADSASAVDLMLFCSGSGSAVRVVVLLTGTGHEHKLWTCFWGG